MVPSGNAAPFVACLAEPPIDLHGPVRRAFSAFWQRPDRVGQNALRAAADLQIGGRGVLWPARPGKKQHDQSYNNNKENRNETKKFFQTHGMQDNDLHFCTSTLALSEFPWWNGMLVLP